VARSLGRLAVVLQGSLAAPQRGEPAAPCCGLRVLPPVTINDTPYSALYLGGSNCSGSLQPEMFFIAANVPYSTRPDTRSG
jgi:hypothetical protein